MNNILGILYFNLPMLFFSAVIIAIGGWLFASAGKSMVKSIGGAFLIAVGGLAGLNHIYFQGFRWLNVIAQCVLVIWIGLRLIRIGPGWVTSVAGGLVILGAGAYLSSVPPVDQFKLDRSASTAFNQGFDDLLEVLGIDNAQNSGQNQREPRSNQQGAR